MQDATHRRPYESLMLCVGRHVTANANAPWESTSESTGVWSQPPDGLIIIGSPLQHSRKPQLDSLLKPYLPQGAPCLEVCFWAIQDCCMLKTIHWKRLLQSWICKPQIRKILKYIPDEQGSLSNFSALVLQLFARGLTRGWTSWGNETLKFQSEGQFSRKENESLF